MDILRVVSQREVEQVERNMAPSIVMRGSVEVDVRERSLVSLREVEQVERNMAPSIVMKGSVEVDVKGKTTSVTKRSGAGGEEYGTLNSDEGVRSLEVVKE